MPAHDPMLTLMAALQALNAMLVGCVAWYFAYHQKRIAQAKLRLDLFDKRFAVFDAARNFLGKALFLGRVEIEDDNAFLIATSGASFLLNDELGSYLKEVQRRAGEVRFIQSELEDTNTEEERAAAQTRFLAERRWLREQTAVLEAKFKPFLQLKE